MGDSLREFAKFFWSIMIFSFLCAVDQSYYLMVRMRKKEGEGGGIWKWGEIRWEGEDGD